MQSCRVVIRGWGYVGEKPDHDGHYCICLDKMKFFGGLVEGDTERRRTMCAHQGTVCKRAYVRLKIERRGWERYLRNAKRKDDTVVGELRRLE